MFLNEISEKELESHLARVSLTLKYTELPEKLEFEDREMDANHLSEADIAVLEKDLSTISKALSVMLFGLEAVILGARTPFMPKSLKEKIVAEYDKMNKEAWEMLQGLDNIRYQQPNLDVSHIEEKLKKVHASLYRLKTLCE